MEWRVDTYCRGFSAICKIRYFWVLFRIVSSAGADEGVKWILFYSERNSQVRNRSEQGGQKAAVLPAKVDWLAPGSGGGSPTEAGARLGSGTLRGTPGQPGQAGTPSSPSSFLGGGGGGWGASIRG